MSLSAYVMVYSLLRLLVFPKIANGAVEGEHGGTPFPQMIKSQCASTLSVYAVCTGSNSFWAYFLFFLILYPCIQKSACLFPMFILSFVSLFRSYSVSYFLFYRLLQVGLPTHVLCILIIVREHEYGIAIVFFKEYARDTHILISMTYALRP